MSTIYFPGSAAAAEAGSFTDLACAKPSPASRLADWHTVRRLSEKGLCIKSFPGVFFLSQGQIFVGFRTHLRWQRRLFSKNLQWQTLGFSMSATSRMADLREGNYLSLLNDCHRPFFPSPQFLKSSPISDLEGAHSLCKWPLGMIAWVIHCGESETILQNISSW